MLSADITIKTGWQLLGATQDMNTTMFNDTCIDYIWKYDTTDINVPEWQVHIANGVDYLHNMTTISSFAKGDGYWVKGNADCTIALAEVTTTTDTNTTVTHNGITYGTVTSPFTGKVWLDRNLGASQVCTALDDTACYGDYYQWGRAADGHEKSDSTTTSTLATTVTAADSSFITPSDNPIDWSTADSDGALRAAEWSKTDGTSICPVGYRVPTETEIESETTGASTAVANKIDAFNNFLKLPSAGYRKAYDGSVDIQGFVSYVWSSSVSSTFSSKFYFISTAADSGYYNRAEGYSVRCVKD